MAGDLILYNGSARTMDCRCPRAQAVAIHGGRITAVGSSEQALSVGPSGARCVDLGGRTVIPGFEDAHLHFTMHGLVLQQVDLTGSESLEEALHRVRAAAESAPAGSWLQGRGWNHNIWPRAAQPSRYDLDSVAEGIPCVFGSKDGHSIWVSSEALRRAGIGPDTPDPVGGQIRRDEHGRPTGILTEQAQSLVMAVVPQPNDSSLLEAARASMHSAAELGVTAIHNCEGPAAWRVLQHLERDGELTVRVWQMIPMDMIDKAVALGLRTGFGNDMLRIGHMKAFADGALGSLTAEMLDPYADRPSSRGVAAHSTEELLAAVRVAVSGGIAPAIHAIGDAAVRRVLDIYETIHSQGLATWYPLRIEHLQIISPKDLPRLGPLGVVASMQPIHATQDMDMANLHWGSRARWSYAWRSVLNSGAGLALGTDCPVESLDPLQGVYAAVTRCRPDGTPAGGWYPEECLTIEQALSGYTLGSATACGQQQQRGSLTVGKVGDVVVLSQDVTDDAPERLLDTRVDMTVLDGNVIFE